MKTTNDIFGKLFAVQVTKECIHNKELLQIDIKKTTDKMGKSDEIIEEQI